MKTDDTTPNLRDETTTPQTLPRGEKRYGHQGREKDTDRGRMCPDVGPDRGGMI